MPGPAPPPGRSGTGPSTTTASALPPFAATKRIVPGLRRLVGLPAPKRITEDRDDQDGVVADEALVALARAGHGHRLDHGAHGLLLAGPVDAGLADALEGLGQVALGGGDVAVAGREAAGLLPAVVDDPRAEYVVAAVGGLGRDGAAALAVADTRRATVVGIVEPAVLRGPRARHAAVVALAAPIAGVGLGVGVDDHDLKVARLNPVGDRLDKPRKTPGEGLLVGEHRTRVVDNEQEVDLVAATLSPLRATVGRGPASHVE